MSILSLMEAKLPPGFRFYPKDEELVCHYLANKVADSGRHSSDAHVMVEVDLNKIEPWDLPETARVGAEEWYFYSLRDRKYATGLRRNRATASGYWKATGKDRQVTDCGKGTVVGMRKTLVFYQGRAPKGRKTDWVMHEFRLEAPSNPPGITFKEDWVLCRVFNKKRGVPSKLWQDNSFDGTEPPPSLPPLADNCLILDQALPNLEGSVQMHCLTNFTKSSTDPSLTHVFPFEPIMPTRDLSNLEPLLGLGNFFNPISCEKRTMGTVLDHLKLEGDQKMELGPRSRGGSLNSYLFEMGLPHMWNYY